MRVFIFNGSIDAGQSSTGKLISNYLQDQLKQKNVGLSVFNLGEHDIPLLNPNELQKASPAVLNMCEAFQNADFHIWLAPLYHGSIPGVMKNCLDWLEVTSKSTPPYLTDKTVGMVCWADGTKAVEGIYAMTAIAHALRAWTVPYSVPVSTQFLYTADGKQEFTDFYKGKLNRLIEIGVSRKIERIRS